ncbi:hypothetical protein KAT72_08020 [Aeromonas popoffii]|uniref:Uncharacterized protein n=1 Tax=Aeromonas popoffii TaxID=70856 RepID=A0ABS5GPG1_9GAMM|nr:hypothetical protein [Aeromonas popoffii]MBR7628976.1 hypothetical protein [Aeromonas popoffii]
MVVKTRYFSSYIKKYMFQPHCRLFDADAVKLLKESQIISDACIYSIVRVAKANFIPESFYPTYNYCFRGEIEANGRVHEVVFNLAKYWFDGESDLSAILRSEFYTLGDFIRCGLSGYLSPTGISISNQEKFIGFSELILSESNDKVLKIKCPIISGINGREVKAELHLYQLINQFDMDLLSNLEICYIGKSNVSTFERLKNHEKWGPILSSKNNEVYDYFAYFFVIDEAAIISRNFMGSNIHFRDSSDLPRGAITEICESTLINHFKPQFNHDFVNSDVKNIGVIKKWLINKGFDYVLTELELEGIMGRLETKTKPYQLNQMLKQRLVT